MGSVHLLRAKAAGGTGRRKGSLDRLWDRIQARAGRVMAQAVKERASARAMLDELMGLPDAGQRLETVEREPRFWTLGMVEHLVETATSAAPASSLDLAEMALALVRRLEPRRYEETLLGEQEVVAWSLWAEAHRRLGDLDRAESGFRSAAQLLAAAPLDAVERATFSRYLARLRRDQGWDDEALGLLQRAAELFGQGQEPAEAGESLSERGWLCLAAGDPASGHPSLEHALELLEKTPRREARLRAWQGLALCYAEMALAEDAELALAAARELYEEAPLGAEALRWTVVEARVANRLGRERDALYLLETARPALVQEGAFHDAAIVALELAQLYAALDRTADVERLRAAVSRSGELETLPQHARSVLLFGFHLASRRDRDATELLAEAGEFLERARERPWLRFQVAGPPTTELSWDLLAPGDRRDLCARAGLPNKVAAARAAELPATERDLLTWTYELLAGVRIVFDPHPQGEGRPLQELTAGLKG